MDEFEKSNLELYKLQSKDRLKSIRSILNTLIKTMPREQLIKVLKEKKIIKYGYSEEKKDLVLIERKKWNHKNETTKNETISILSV